MVFVFVSIVWVFSLCLHEFSHAFVAYLGGDYTVKDKGYLSFNPLRYAHPTLSILMPLLFLLVGGIGLPGGAVYIETHRLRSRAWDCAVSLAGPAANAVLVLILALPFQLGLVDPNTDSLLWAAYSFVVLLQIMAVLFNLIPIPPLDGFGAISAWFSHEAKYRAMLFGRHGLLIVLMLFWFVEPVAQAFWNVVFLITHTVGVPVPLAIQGLQAFRLF